MKFQFFRLFFLVFVLCLSYAHALTLDQYLGEVRGKNGAVKGAELSSSAKGLRLDEGSLFFKPSFFLTAEYYDDQRPTNAPAIQGFQTLRHTLRSGFSENLRTGTRATLSYNYYKTQLNGVNPAFLPNKKFFDVAPMLEVTQSLWRNFLGSEFEASEALQNSQTEASRYLDQYNLKLLLMNAENAYWRLYFAQTSLKVQQESLERAKRLRDWNSQRVRNNLVDESELIQAEANLQNREMEYQDTLTEVDTALQDFNSIRETEGDINLEGSRDKDSDYILNASLPERAPLREDVLASAANQRAAVANTVLGTQRNRPNLELYGQYSINGRDKQYKEAYEQAMSAQRPFSIVGVRFTTPIDFGALNDYKKAYAQEKLASEMAYKRKAFEVQKEWDILTKRFNNFKKRLSLSQKLVSISEKKLVTEKKRYNQGRTTTFQVLQFEQDFANAQLIKLRNERELILVYNQLKLFSGVSQ